MPALILTNAGRQAAIDAANNGLQVRLETLVFGGGQYTPDGTETAVQNELARTTFTSSRRIDDQLALFATVMTGGWSAYEVGVLLDTGTLFAVASSGTGGEALAIKSGADLILTVNLLLTGVDPTSVTVTPNIQLSVDRATTTRLGVAELADDTEGPGGTDNERIMTSRQTRRHGDARYLRKAGGTMTGALNLVTPAANDNSKKAVNSEWVRGFAPRPVVLDQGFDLAAGATTARALSESLTGFRWVNISFLQNGGFDSIFIPVASIRATLADYPHALYLASRDFLYTVNPQTGVATLVGALGTGGTNTDGLASHSGVLYLSESTGTDSLYTVNPQTGVATLVGALGQVGPNGLASHSGVLYMADDGTDSLYTVNPQTGVATLVGPFGGGISSPNGLASHSGVLYLASRDSLYTVNPQTGVATLVGAFGGGISSPNGLASHNSTLYMTDSTTDSLYTVNPQTGAASLVGAFGGGIPNPNGLASHDRVHFDSFAFYGSGINLTFSNAPVNVEILDIAGIP